METWIMRKMGNKFNPETHCQYTGKNLYQFPMLGGPGNSEPTASDSMGYWREDGELMRCRRLTPEEIAWIIGKPEAFMREREEFEAWLRPLQKAAELRREKEFA